MTLWPKQIDKNCAILQQQNNSIPVAYNLLRLKSMDKFLDRICPTDEKLKAGFEKAGYK